MPTVKIALFLTTEPELARRLLAAVAARHPQAHLAVFVSDELRQALASQLALCDARRDKPSAGKLAFVRALRAERFDEVVVAWHGGDRLQPLRFVALGVGAARVLVHDDRGREFAVAWWQPWTWGAHAMRRLLAVRAFAALQLLASAYRLTVGAVLGGAMLVPLLVASRRRARVGKRA